MTRSNYLGSTFTLSSNLLFISLIFSFERVFSMILTENRVEHKPLPYEKRRTFLFVIYYLVINKLIKLEYNDPQ